LTVVVDASVAVQWVLLQEHSAAARTLFQSRNQLAAVDFVRVDVLNALLKAVRTKRLALSEATLAIQYSERAPVRLHPVANYASAAFAIAQRHGGSVYDACYVALARALDAPLATDDEGMATVAEAVGVTVHRASRGFAQLLD
jgi:predicted nucleic acid-binding protein